MCQHPEPAAHTVAHHRGFDPPLSVYRLISVAHSNNQTLGRWCRPAEDHAQLAVALWMRPGVGPDEETVMGVMGESLDDQILNDVNGLFEQMEELHPADVWYLPLIGVDPVAQGRGLGSALLRHATETCDNDGLPAYLEATNPRNRDLYARHGFNVVDVIQAGTSPPMWAMLREPAAS